MSLEDRPTAILCDSSQITTGAMSAVYEDGYSIPREFSLMVLGYSYF